MSPEKFRLRGHVSWTPPNPRLPQKAARRRAEAPATALRRSPAFSWSILQQRLDRAWRVACRAGAGPLLHSSSARWPGCCVRPGRRRLLTRRDVSRSAPMRRERPPKRRRSCMPSLSRYGWSSAVALWLTGNPTAWVVAITITGFLGDPHHLFGPQQPQDHAGDPCDLHAADAGLHAALGVDRVSRLDRDPATFSSVSHGAVASRPRRSIPTADFVDAAESPVGNQRDQVAAGVRDPERGRRLFRVQSRYDDTIRPIPRSTQLLGFRRRRRQGARGPSRAACIPMTCEALFANMTALASGRASIAGTRTSACAGRHGRFRWMHLRARVLDDGKQTHARADRHAGRPDGLASSSKTSCARPRKRPRPPAAPRASSSPI